MALDWLAGHTRLALDLGWVASFRDRFVGLINVDVNESSRSSLKHLTPEMEEVRDLPVAVSSASLKVWASLSPESG